MSDPGLKAVTPVLHVRDVPTSAAYYQSRLGFKTDFLYGVNPFYGSVSRDGVCLHLRHVDNPNFAELAAREMSLILATIEVSDVQGLFDEFQRRGAEIAQPPIRQPWGGTEFQVRDPDGNVISFVAYVSERPQASTPG